MIEVCSSEAELRSVIIDDEEMYERAGCDGGSRETILLNQGLWLKWVDEGDSTIKALCVFKVESIYVLEVHIHIPKQFRGKGTLDKGRDFLNWIVEQNLGKYVKINTKIPVIHRDVILFAMKLGFKREGTNRLSIVKNGILMDQAIMGLTFGEVAQWVESLAVD